MISRATLHAAALLLSFFGPSLLGAEVWDGIPYASDPKALLAAAEAVPPTEPEAAVVVLLDESVVTIGTDGRATRVDRLIFRVLSQSAVDGWATIETTWSPWFHDRPEVDARVVTATGAVHRLDPKSFGVSDAEDEPDMFSDMRVLSGPIPAVAPGSVVEQTVTYRQKNALFETGVADRFTLGRWVETRQSRLVIEHPSDVAVALVNRTEPRVEPVRSEREGVTRLVFETGPRPALEDFEWNVPSDVPTRSFIAWSTGKSWQDVAQRYARIVDGVIGDSSRLGTLAKSAVGDASEPREIAERLLAKVVRDIRYAGVEFGEGSLVPRTPAETLANKYGDCKDKAALLVALLREAGVTAHLALIRSGSGYDVEPNLPGMGHFNHVIVVTEGPEPIWIDPTDDFARAGELPDGDQGRLVLIARDDTTELVRTPVAASSVNRVVERREFWLAEDGRARVNETTEYHGSDERSNRRFYASADLKQVGEDLGDYAENAYMAKTLAKWTSSPAHDLSAPFVLHLEMSEAKRGMTGDGESAVAIFVSRMTSEFPPELHRTDEGLEKSEIKARRNEFAFYKPFVLEVDYRIHPPPGYTVRELPRNETLSLATASLTKTYAVEDDGTVRANYRVDSGPRRISSTQFEEMRKAIVKLNEEPAYLLYFDQVARLLLESGKVGEAVAEHRRLAEMHPAEGLHHAEMARALLAGGLGAAARRAAARGVAVEPTSARAHATQGFVLASDLIGREMGAGSDVKRAIAAYQKAKALAPDDLQIRAELAILLQHSDKGVRYSDPARLDAAIAEYLAMKEEIEEVDEAAVDRELMLLYSHRSRWKELRTLLSQTSDTTMKELYTLVVEGAESGAEAALKASLALPLTTRRDVQTRAGSLLALLRYYPAAAELSSAAAQGSSSAAQTRAMADVLRKTVRFEDMKLEASDPESLFRLAVLDLFKGVTEEELNLRYATKEAALVFGDWKDEGAEPAAKRTQLKRVIAREDAQTKFYADLALSSFTIERDGDEKVGIRLRGRSAGIGRSDTFTAYVVREDGKYRVAASDTTPAELALQALRRAEAGDAAAARQWLDWAREHVKGGSDDPVASNPFAAIWTRGRDVTTGEARVAAALLLPHTRRSAEIAIPVLVDARRNASGETEWRIDQALARSYHLTEQWEELLVVADRLAARFPDSPAAFAHGVIALKNLERLDDLRARSNERLTRLPGDEAALSMLGSAALDAGQYEEAVRFFEETLRRADAKAGNFNNHAWASVFGGGTLGNAVTSARHAVSEASSHAVLNTLAVVLAENGDSSEAREVLLKSLEMSDSEELGGADWYVVGRIAENYGIVDAATEAYRNVKLDEDDEVHGSPFELARRRLAALGES